MCTYSYVVNSKKRVLLEHAFFCLTYVKKRVIIVYYQGVIQMKTCPKCQTEKALSEYYINNNAPSAYCKPCFRTAASQRITARYNNDEAYKEMHKQKVAAYYQANKQRKAAYDKKRRELIKAQKAQQKG